MNNDNTDPDAWAQLARERQKRSSVEGIADLALGGDAESARKMIAMAEHCVERSDIPDPVRGYLLQCLSRILSGEDADRAFNLRRNRRGAPRDFWAAERDADLYRGVAGLVKQGATMKRACEQVASRVHVSKETVEKAYKRYRTPRGK